jgi:hypothetical protein
MRVLFQLQLQTSWYLVGFDLFCCIKARFRNTALIKATI